MMLSWDREVLVQGWSDGSEATPEHMGELTLRAIRGLIDLSHPQHADAGCEGAEGRWAEGRYAVIVLGEQFTCQSTFMH
jgi:hypothetical protein